MASIYRRNEVSSFKEFEAFGQSHSNSILHKRKDSVPTKALEAEVSGLSACLIMLSRQKARSGEAHNRTVAFLSFNFNS